MSGRKPRVSEFQLGWILFGVFGLVYVLVWGLTLGLQPGSSHPGDRDWRDDPDLPVLVTPQPW